MFSKGGNFRDFLIVLMYSLVLPKIAAPRGANSFLSELTPIQEGGKNENGSDVSPFSVPIHLKG